MCKMGQKWNDLDQKLIKRHLAQIYFLDCAENGDMGSNSSELINNGQIEMKLEGEKKRSFSIYLNQKSSCAYTLK